MHDIVTWLKTSGEQVSIFKFDQEFQDCRVQKLVNVIYRMIMRQGSNLDMIILVLTCQDFLSLLLIILELQI